jgi:hypothetical protein
MSATITVTKLIQYPPINPDKWIVGFTTNVGNGNQFYLETSISLTSATTSQEAVNMALSQLANTINNQIASMQTASPLIGSTVELPTAKTSEAIGTVSSNTTSEAIGTTNTASST